MRKTKKLKLFREIIAEVLKLRQVVLIVPTVIERLKVKLPLYMPLRHMGEWNIVVYILSTGNSCEWSS
jgi:hypothetical protein